MEKECDRGGETMTIDDKDARGKTIQGRNLRFPHFLSRDKRDNFDCFSGI